ncbi:MAG TPA: MarR family transcriptional regulator [Opitutaceae bacterium]|nr:MarR family transcriptional regulator [Opitutaceae bacterium]
MAASLLGVPTPPPITPERLYLILWKAFYAVEAHDRRSIRALGFASDSDFALLEALYSKGALPVNTLGRKLLLTSGSITTAVDRAVKQGWVRRTADPADKRVALVALTDCGRERARQALRVHFRNLAGVMGGLEPGEQSQLAALLRKLGKHAQQLVENG